MERKETSGKNEVGDCQVCEQSGHGIHFGVISCRACAAFFRRTIVFNREYPCRKGDEKCAIEKGSRIICRRCRYNKCVKLGMTSDNVQYNRDKMRPTTSKGHKSKDTDLPTDLSPPPPPKPLRLESLFTPIDRTANDDVIERFEQYCSSFDPARDIPDIWEQTPLNRMYSALRRHRRDQVLEVEKLQFITKIDFKNMGGNWEHHIFNVVEWYLCCKEFNVLPFKQKLEIFQDRWKTFMRLERLLMSAEFFGPSILQDKVMLFGKNIAAYVKNIKVDMSSVSDHDPEKLKSYFAPVLESTFEKVLTPIVNLNISHFESVYLLCQLAFTVEGLDLPYETIDSFVSFRDQISDDLHNYYTSIGLTNYASRLMDILVIVQSMESVQTQREQIMDLVRIFDYIKLDEGQSPCCSLKSAAKKYMEKV